MNSLTIIETAIPYEATSLRAFYTPSENVTGAQGPDDEGRSCLIDVTDRLMVRVRVRVRARVRVWVRVWVRVRVRVSQCA